MDALKATIQAYDNDVERYVTKLEFDLPKEALDKFASLLPGKRVLDAGCGAGRDTAYLFAKGLEATGIDLSERMIAYAKDRTNASFAVMDIRKTSFASGSFDGILCYNTALHLNKQDLSTTTSEFYHLLKTGGVLFLSTKEGDGEDVKERDNGKKHFYLYRKSFLVEQLSKKGFEVLETTPYNRNDEQFVDLFLKKK